MCLTPPPLPVQCARVSAAAVVLEPDPHQPLVDLTKERRHHVGELVAVHRLGQVGGLWQQLLAHWGGGQGAWGGGRAGQHGQQQATGKGRGRGGGGVQAGQEGEQYGGPRLIRGVPRD